MYRVKNAFKIALVVIFFPFLAFLMLGVGIGSKNRMATLEGAAYALMFILGIASWSWLTPVLGLGAMALSGSRAFWRRDLWLDGPTGRRRTNPQNLEPRLAPAQVTRPPAESTLSSAVAWASNHAKANRHRLPADSYGSILTCCSTLHSVIEAENAQPSRDALFEYELEALTERYLPMVLKGYLAIPADMVDTRQPNGRTPNEELAEQLNLLQSQADALHATRHGASSARLTSSGNFLRERFGHHQKQFDFGVE